MKLIVGLGNPGKKYAQTRHNTGFLAVDVLAGNTKWQANKKFNVLTAEVAIAGTKVLLAKPQTFMNESGLAVRQLADFYHLDINNILIIYDDIDLLISQTRLKKTGSSGGHNGLASIIEHLGTNDINRLKIGIAEKTAGKQSVPAEVYVLKPFSRGANAIIKKTLAIIPELVSTWLLP
ncbi:MAG: aminoacyl-tRNA hydrolase [Candidatus Komeilibacteria bacterium]|nr:aminoacyl-tRNA hydrolase [Candidatus Komeilibacteria bacterium]